MIKPVIFVDRSMAPLKDICDIFSMFDEHFDSEWAVTKPFELKQFLYINEYHCIARLQSLECLANYLGNQNIRIIPYSDFQYKYRYRKGDFCLHRGIVRYSKVKIVGMKIDLARNLTYIVKRCSDGECYSAKSSSLMAMENIEKAYEHTLTGKRYFIPGRCFTDFYQLLDFLGAKELPETQNENLYYHIEADGKVIAYTREEINGHVKGFIQDMGSITYMEETEFKDGSKYIKTLPLIVTEDEDFLMMKVFKDTEDYGRMVYEANVYDEVAVAAGIRMNGWNNTDLKLKGKRYFVPGNIGIDNLCYILTSLGVKGLQQNFDERLFYCINSEGRAVGYTEQEIEGHVKAIITDLDGIVFPHGKKLTGGKYISSWIDSEENEDKIMLKFLSKNADGINRIIMVELFLEMGNNQENDSDKDTIIDKPQSNNTVICCGKEMSIENLSSLVTESLIKVLNENKE